MARTTQDFRVDFTTLLSPTGVFGVPNESYIQQTTSVEALHAGTAPVLARKRKGRLAGRRLLQRRRRLDRPERPRRRAGHAQRHRLPSAGRRHDRLEVQGIRGVRERDHQVHAELRSHARRPLQQQRPGRACRMRTDCCSVWRRPPSTTGDSSEDVFTYSIAPKFKLNDRMAIYARVAKGFRPGGPNVIAPDAPPGRPPATAPIRPSTTNWASRAKTKPGRSLST